MNTDNKHKNGDWPRTKHRYMYTTDTCIRILCILPIDMYRFISELQNVEFESRIGVLTIVLPLGVNCNTDKENSCFNWRRNPELSQASGGMGET
jgi:hypothetical protein